MKKQLPYVWDERVLFAKSLTIFDGKDSFVVDPSEATISSVSASLGQLSLAEARQDPKSVSIDARYKINVFTGGAARDSVTTLGQDGVRSVAYSNMFDDPPSGTTRRLILVLGRNGSLDYAAANVTPSGFCHGKFANCVTFHDGAGCVRFCFQAELCHEVGMTHNSGPCIDKTFFTYTRKMFDIIPSSLVEIAKQEAECLGHLDSERFKYDNEFPRIVKLCLDQSSGFGAVGRYAPTYAYVAEFQSGAYGALKYKYSYDEDNANFGKSMVNRLQIQNEWYDSNVITQFSIEQISIVQYYQRLVNDAQNIVLDQLIALHPQIAWPEQPFATSDIKGVISEYIQTLYSSEFVRAPWSPSLKLAIYAYAEAWPTDPSFVGVSGAERDGKVDLLLNTKILWADDLITAGLSGHALSPAVIENFRRYFRASLAEGMLIEAQKHGAIITDRLVVIVDDPSLCTQPILRSWIEAWNSTEVGAVTEFHTNLINYAREVDPARTLPRGFVVMCEPHLVFHALKKFKNLFPFDSELVAKKPNISSEKMMKFGSVVTSNMVKRIIGMCAGGFAVCCSPQITDLGSAICQIRSFGFSVIVLTASDFSLNATQEKESYDRFLKAKANSWTPRMSWSDYVKHYKPGFDQGLKTVSSYGHLQYLPYDSSWDGSAGREITKENIIEETKRFVSMTEAEMLELV